MNGKDFILLLNEQGYISSDASHVQVIASIGGYLSVTAEYKTEATNETNEELDRLKSIEARTARLIELLTKGEVDYDLVEEIKAIING